MSTNLTFTGVGPDSINFVLKVNLLHIGVQNASIGISLDNGQNFLILDEGFHTFKIGIITKMKINGTGAWQIIGSFNRKIK